MSTPTMTPGMTPNGTPDSTSGPSGPTLSLLPPRSPDLPPPAVAERGHRPRWVVPAAVAAVLAILGLVGWLLWSNWVPSAPASLSAKAPTAVSAELTWTAPTSGPDVDRYLVLRNGDQVASVPADATSYLADDLVPDTAYRFTVVAASGSKRSDPSPELVVHTLPAQPSGLNASPTTATSARLTWQEPEQGPDPESWVILRDGSQVATVDGDITSYLDEGLSPGRSYTYQVMASSGTSRSTPSEELVARTLPATPTGLKATAQTTTTVLVGWGYPEGLTPDAFVVLREGKVVGTVPGTARTFLDKTPVPATTYEYTVRADTDGLRSQQATPVEVTTPTPPPADARLSGSYDVDGTITKSTSGITLGSAAALGQDVWSRWTFTPKCTTGACDAVIKGRLAGHEFTMTVVRKGAVYSGTTTAHVSHCKGLTGDIEVKNTVALQLTVRAGELSSRAWVADSWAATLRMTSPYTSAGSSGSMRYYCPSGSLTASLTATR